MDESLIKPGDPLDEALVKRTVEKLVQKYDDKYPFAEITPHITRDEPTGTATITFQIKENLRTAINQITFVGNEHIADADLRPVLENTSTWAWAFDPDDYPGARFAKFSWLTGNGRFHKEGFRNDIEKLREFYRNQGFLDIQIPLETTEQKYTATDTRTGDLDIAIKISEGTRYTVGTITLQGNTLGTPAQTTPTAQLTPQRHWELTHFSTPAILAALAQRRRDLTRPYPLGNRILDQLFSGGIRAREDTTGQIRTNFDSLSTGDWYSPKAIETAAEKIRDHYGQHGYLNTQVRITRNPDTQTGQVHLTIHILEGTKVQLGSINIRGNTRTRGNVIIRELLLAPGEVFDTVRMKNSETALRNTRLFTNVHLAPEITNTNIPHQRDLRIDLTEGSTGQIEFGVGFSTLEELFAFAQYSEGNFDLLNYANYFRGGGQKFRLRLQIGTRTRSIEHDFEEPWAGTRELALGYHAYLTSNSYDSSDYETQRLGLNLYARRRLYENIEATLGYTIEKASLKNIAWNAPPFIRLEEGDRLISKATLTLTRDTRNDAYFPTTGNRFSLFQHIAGGPLGGDVNYYKLELHAAQWIPLFEEGEQTLQLLARLGSMVHYGDGHIPFYERFRLGGAYTMRGFRYHHIGRFDGGEPTGGNAYAYLSTEYSIRLFEQLRFVLFYDWGFVNNQGFNLNARHYNDDAGFGFRILIMGALVRIDIGFPITTSKDNNDGVQFNFSFGASF
ncbi:MAG: outer membrane protein assembly factor [Puniceicoccales bacterium]|nr:outer membrane protein assembly factor [Puniceicoccales bacterium]